MEDAKVIELVNQASLKFLEPLEPHEMYKIIVDEAIKLVHATYGSILLEQNNILKRVYVSSHHLQNLKIRKRGFTYQAFKTRKPLVLDVGTVAEINPQLRNSEVKSIIIIPLSYKKKSIGVLTVQSLKEKNFSERELNILKLFGSMATLAIRKTQLYDETKKALETRDLFISLASHELRTPLTTLNGYIQLLHRKIGSEETTEGKWVRELYTESGRLTNLVKELLEVNRIKQGQLQFSLQECRIGEIIDQAVKRIAVTGTTREIVFINKAEKGKDIVIGDSEKLLQMFTAFIGNALKFSPPDSEVKIILLTKQKQVITQIIDKGDGIREKDLPFIFDEFYKGENSNQKEGMGVGLLLAKQIITYHKGSIKVDSKENKGTTVEVSIPRTNI